MNIFKEYCIQGADYHSLFLEERSIGDNYLLQIPHSNYINIIGTDEDYHILKGFYAAINRTDIHIRHFHSVKHLVNTYLCNPIDTFFIATKESINEPEIGNNLPIK